MQQTAPVSHQSKLPVTVLSGFLGNRVHRRVSNHDFFVHALGVALLIGSGYLSFRLADRRLQRRVSSFFVLVPGLLLASGVMHLLPNAIADFIYGSQQNSISNNPLDGH